MFLKSKILSLLVLSLLSSSTFAQAQPIEAGTYKLVEGEKGLCRNFDLSLKDLKSKHIKVSGSFGFELRNSNHEIESDLDANCTFKEQNKIDEQGQELILTRINQEICSGQVRSKTVSTVILEAGKIELSHNINGAQLNCRWEK